MPAKGRSAYPACRWMAHGPREVEGAGPLGQLSCSGGSDEVGAIWELSVEQELLNLGHGSGCL